MKLSRLASNSKSTTGWLGTVWRGAEPIAGNAVASTSKLSLPGLGAHWQPSALDPVISAGPIHKPIKPIEPKLYIPTSNSIKTCMISHLSAGEGRRALHLFRLSLTNPVRNYDQNTLAGLIWLFFDYNESTLALEAIIMMKEKGFSIPIRISSKLLQTATDQLILNLDQFELSITWLRDGILLDKTMDSNQVETILEILKRLGKTDSVLELFQVYQSSLPFGDIPGPRLWSIVISAVGETGDLVGARNWFNKWRNEFMKQSNLDSITPERPYLTLLTQIIANSPSNSLEPYKFLPLLDQDKVPFSTTVFNSLLQLELSRRQFESFWKLWQKMEEEDYKKDSKSWKLAIKAKKWENGTIQKRGRVMSSRARVPNSPNHRNLFSTFLKEHQKHTNHRPSLVQPNSKPSIMTVGVLNSFLELFIASRDFSACVIGLETFSIAGLVPNQQTHGNLIIGIVKAWENSKLQKMEELENELGISFGSKRQKGISELGSLEMLKKILGKRKMRVELWTEKDTFVNETEGIGEEVGRKKSSILSIPVIAPEWMKERELRDTTYLISLLQKCEGKDNIEWRVALKLARQGLVPMQEKLSSSELSRAKRLEKYKLTISKSRG